MSASQLCHQTREPHWVQNRVVAAAPQFQHNFCIVCIAGEEPILSIGSATTTSCFFAFHLYILNTRPPTAATALIEPVMIPTIEPVDSLEEVVGDADVEVPVDVAIGPLVCVTCAVPPPVVVAAVVFGSESLPPHRI